MGFLVILFTIIAIIVYSVQVCYLYVNVCIDPDDFFEDVKGKKQRINYFLYWNIPFLPLVMHVYQQVIGDEDNHG